MAAIEQTSTNHRLRLNARRTKRLTRPQRLQAILDILTEVSVHYC